MLDLRTYDAITFDCYGTLIDWQTGIVRALRPLHEELGVRRPDHEIVAAYGPLERVAEAGDWRPYRHVLRDVTRGYLGADCPDQYLDALGESIKHWEPFEDSLPALGRLGDRYRLGALTNIDDDLFEPSGAALDDPFELVVTAQRVRSYKPERAHFDAALVELGLSPERVLHVAESRYHDIAPARELGFSTVWVNRQGEGPSASGFAADAMPDLVVSSLAELAELVDQAFRVDEPN